MDTTVPLSPRNAYVQELALALDRRLSQMGTSTHSTTTIQGVTVLRSEDEMEPIRAVLKPAIYISFNGVERAIVGGRRYDYEVGQASIITNDVSANCNFSFMHSTCAYLGLLIELDPVYTKEVVDELGIIPNPSANLTDGRFSLDLSSQLLDCVLRTVRLFDNPEAIPMLYPGIMREIRYWLFTGSDRDKILRMLMAENHDRRVVQAIKHIRDKFNEPICVGDLASAVCMSPATLHRQFKSVTSMSPVQYQKKLRLLEARRLMFAGDSNVASVAFEVGYVSASQFFREYTRMFGASPRRDMAIWKTH